MGGGGGGGGAADDMDGSTPVTAAGGDAADGGIAACPSAGGLTGWSPPVLLPRLPNIAIFRYALFWPVKRASSGASPLRF